MKLNSKIIAQAGSAEAGSTAFFVSAVVLPLLFFVFTLGLDLNKYFFERDRLQKAADRAVSYSYRFLPFKEAAISAVRARLISEGVLKQSQFDAAVKISVRNDQIDLEIRALSQLIFARYFAVEAGIPMQVSASVRGPALDVFLALDVSSYLAPDPEGDTAWGNYEDWPAAQYFMFDRLFYRDGKMISSQLITQQCFNPTFSKLKTTAIELFDYFSSFSTSSVGLGFYPGAVGSIDIVRPLLSPGSVSDEIGEALFIDYQGTYQADAYCAAAAQAEQTHADYNFRNAQSPGSGYQISGPSEYAGRDVIWGKAVMTSAQADTVLAVREISNILLAGSKSSLRGSLVNTPDKVAVLLSGDLPRMGNNRFPETAVKLALAEEFRKLRLASQESSAQISIYFVVYPTPNQEIDFSELLQFLETQSTDKFLRLKLLSGENAAVASAIMLDKQTAIISK